MFMEHGITGFVTTPWCKGTPWPHTVIVLISLEGSSTKMSRENMHSNFLSLKHNFAQLTFNMNNDKVRYRRKLHA